MKRKYRVYDTADGLFGNDYYIEANSPTRALEMLGYKQIRRDTTGKIGRIVVYGIRGSYVYSAIKEE